MNHLTQGPELLGTYSDQDTCFTGTKKTTLLPPRIGLIYTLFQLQGLAKNCSVFDIPYQNFQKNVPYKNYPLYLALQGSHT